MLRIIQNSTAAGAKSYYSTADYYTEGQELQGVWRGKGAERLGLSGEIEKSEWDALCDNKDPATGKTLTLRQKANRRVGYDFNFHVPKSVSLLYGLTEDSRLLAAFQDAVRATMHDMEDEMQTRVRQKGGNDDRTTGNMVWGEFVHTTARPVDGVPDPHLHAHCFVFNSTWDEREGRWKAGQFAALKRDAPYFEAVFHSRLAHGLAELGLPIERTKKGWEIAGLAGDTLAKFSRRTAEIEEKAKEKGITDPKKKGELGAKTRSGKAKELTLPELQDAWRARLSTEESDTVRGLASLVGGEATPEDPAGAATAVSRAIGHCFERQSVVPERVLVTRALRNGYGTSSPESVAEEVAEQNLLRADRKGQRYVTTREVLAEEQGMIDFAKSGRGACRPLAPGGHPIKRDWLNADQRRAVSHVLTSRDRVVLIRGGAGTGKTSMMQETAEALEAAGHKVFAFAPSADASRGVLRSQGFSTADTVARLLLDERLQQQLHGQVLWVDEAGLLSARTTAQLFRLAGRLDARLVLSGDPRQHGSVERGATLRLLEEEAGLVPAEIREIQRQKGDYKSAVKALSEGNTEAGFRQLDRLGWVREVSDAERYKCLAADYVAAVEARKSALVVCPSHREGDQVQNAIRSHLKSIGKVGPEDRTFEVLENVHLTEAERSDPVSYRPDEVLVFHQNAKGYTKGQRVPVAAGPVPLSQAARFQVFRRRKIALARGDMIRITRGGTTADGKHKLNNGTLYSVRDFDKLGNIVLTNGWTIARAFSYIAPGYCVTSHASQGQTVNCVFISQASESFPASSREQFYVSASRGRQQVVVFTDDKQALLEAVSRSDDRTTATELLRRRAQLMQQVPDRTNRAEPRKERGQRSEERVNG